MSSTAAKMAGILKDYRKILMIVIFPSVTALLPIIVRTKEAYCAYVVVLMCFFWLTTSLPMGITSLFPVVLFPAFGIMSSSSVTSGYFQDIVMLFFGTLVVSTAIEQTRLHERIALRLLTLVGTEPKWLLLGFMSITACLSMFISNAAATSITLPIIMSVVRQLIKFDPKYHQKIHIEKSNIFSELPVESREMLHNHFIDIVVESGCSTSTELNSIESQTTVIKEELKIVVESESSNEYKTDEARRLATAFLMSCAYSAVIGGVGSLVGCASNMLLKGYITNNYPQIPLSFLTFMLFGFPIAFILIILSWIWLTIRWLPKSFKCGKKVGIEGEIKTNFNDILVKRFEELGPINWSQTCVAVIFGCLVLAWITREFGTLPGWSVIFPNSKFITDTTPAIVAIILIFICPRENIFKGHPYRHLIDYSDLQKSFPWSIVLLCGGALVMAQGFEASGLSDWIGEHLKSLGSLNKEISLIIIILIGISTSEFASNTADTAILLPIIDSVAKQHDVNPLYFLLPLVFSVNLAFMMPLGTANMTIVYTVGNLRIKDMVLTGFVMNVLSFLVILLASNTWLFLIFDMKTSYREFQALDSILTNKTNY